MKRTGKVIPVLIMGFCMVFFTGINFVLYPSSGEIASNIEQPSDSNDQNIPSGPIEEKTPPTPLEEEYIHEHFTFQDVIPSKFNRLKGHQSERLEIIYYELLSPPPELIYASV